MAAGLTVDRGNLGRLRTFFEEAASNQVAALVEDQVLEIDGALGASGATFDLIDQLEEAGPYGSGHTQPVFALPFHRIEECRYVGTNHIRVSLRAMDGARIEAMAFRATDTDLGRFLLSSRGDQVHVAGPLSGDYWQGSRRIQFRIMDAARAV